MTTETAETIEARADRLIKQEVFVCVSGLVHTLSQNFGEAQGELGAMCEQAFELSRPIEDYEEAAIEAGWTLSGGVWTHEDFEDAETSAEAACARSDVEPHEWDVYEHWAVTDWFAHRLAEKGERIDSDFYGLTVWGRTTTGQMICMDSVILDIAKELLEPVAA